MKLKDQVHVYTYDTSCFYTNREYKFHQKLIRLYALRAALNRGSKLHQYTRLSKLINYYKDLITQEFQHTREKQAIRHLRLEDVCFRNVISIFSSFLTRTIGCEINELSDALVVIQVYFYEIAEDLIREGFLWKNEKYVLFSASAGQIRTKKFVMIKESLLKQHEQTLMCGLTVDKINELGGINVNKFLAYYALANSATAEWKEFDIDKAIVVDDWETDVVAEVDYIDDVTYEITRQKMPVPIPHTDGCGIMIKQRTRMVRLPWVKGLLVKFDFHKFIREYCGEDIEIADIYGVKHKIIAEDIQYIFTKSQFKMYKYYSSWEEYKDCFKAFNCHAGYVNDEKFYIDDAQINYQMLQSLRHMTYAEMKQLAKATNDEIDSIGKDFGKTLKLLGVDDCKEDMNYMQKSLLIYPELLHDTYSKTILKDIKQSLVKEGKAGKLRVHGKYTFVAPDLFAFCQWLFLRKENPQGLLQNGEVSCRLYKNKNKLDCLRSPHLYREHALRVNIRNAETDKWFDTKCIYTSCHDVISKVLQLDCDGDTLLVIKDNNLQGVAQSHMKDIVPLYYNMKKGEPTVLSKDSMFQGLMFAYTKGNIGKYSNAISKIENQTDFDEERSLRAIKWLVFENNMCIDSAKTLYMPERPKWVDDEIKVLTQDKLPHFFVYAKDKLNSQVEKVNKTPVNYLETIIHNPRIKFQLHIDKYDIRFLLKNDRFVWLSEYHQIIEKYDYFNQHKYLFFNHHDEAHRGTEDLFVYQQIKKELLALPFSADIVIDSLIYFMYTQRKASGKKTLWGCFGEEIYENIQKNILNYYGKGIKICPECGRRFRGKYLQFCSDKCRDLSLQKAIKKRNKNYYKKFQN